MNAKIERDLERLKERVVSGDFASELEGLRLWGGGDVIIHTKMTPTIKKWLEDQPLVISPQKLVPMRRAVITPCAKELTWLFHQLRDIYRGQMDHISKYDFFGLLAQSAIDYQENNPDYNCVDLLLAVIEGARKYPELRKYR